MISIDDDPINKIEFDCSERTQDKPNYVYENNKDKLYKWVCHNGGSNIVLLDEDGNKYHPSGKKKGRFDYYIINKEFLSKIKPSDDKYINQTIKNMILKKKNDELKSVNEQLIKERDKITNVQSKDKLLIEQLKNDKEDLNKRIKELIIKFDGLVKLNHELEDTIEQRLDILKEDK